ncbi:hypothetical protein GRI38_10715 [Altererythrobacter aurantiacus]|uniref:Outer membrane protein beta-barrel domain-containing protein n=1 Tax=Parapontixanthobacter aurantiacus TaxID=1463599 RepID=A0A844ZH77_9SPHN|nr:porin family protein [Parapontixanthobacter aurantiacus]MXO86496.1 hypothetical protein [Parapontixanthobacter aurantiacus]
MKRILIGAGLCLASTPALAQEHEAMEGFRAEALVGYDRIDLSIDEEADADGNTDDIYYGGAIGYDIVTNGFLLGVEGEIGTSGHDAEEPYFDVIDGQEVNGTISLSDGLNWYVGGRIGTVAFDRTLFYAKAGYASTTLDLDLEGTVDGEPGSADIDINFGGIRLGAGVEQSFGRAYGKLEYRYTSYSDGHVDYDGTSVDIGDELDGIDLERHQIVAGVGFRF